MTKQKKNNYLFKVLLVLKCITRNMEMKKDVNQRQYLYLRHKHNRKNAAKQNSCTQMLKTQLHPCGATSQQIFIDHSLT